MLDRLLFPLLATCCAALLAVSPAAAQSSNLDTVEGPGSGEKTTLTITPHRLTDRVSARALGVKSPAGTRWALTLIGVSPSDSLRLTLGEEPLPLRDLTRPAEGDVGPTRLYLSRSTFRTVAERGAVRLHIGDTATSFPEQMRTEMQQILEDVI
mgnify:FL=1